jgi:hypothetical protein
MCDRRGNLPVLPEARWGIFFENLFVASRLCAKLGCWILDQNQLGILRFDHDHEVSLETMVSVVANI